jgi:hypothetical protein
MAEKRSQGDKKGPHSEELLRNYFLAAGYFVVRGVPFKYEGFDVTDIDLWLYNRVSSVSRELSIVDIKNKRTPQAIERIFWTKGLQEALGVSRAIVATTENRHEVKEFGKKMDVLVLDGRFLQRLSISSPSPGNRVTDEEFLAFLTADTLGKLGGDWGTRLRSAKAALADGLSYDSFNYWLQQAHFFAEQVLSRHQHRVLGYRCFYTILSYAAVAVDYILRDLSFLEEYDREKILRDGFIYGSRGRSGTKNLIDASIGLANEIRTRVEAEIAALPANILSQYFAKVETGRVLFDVAKELDVLSGARSFRGHHSASAHARSLIGCLLDFWGIDRRAFSTDNLVSNQQDVAIPHQIEANLNDMKHSKMDVPDDK